MATEREKDTLEAIKNRLVRQREHLDEQRRDLDEQINSLDKIRYTISGELIPQGTGALQAAVKVERVKKKERLPITDNLHKFKETGKSPFTPRDAVDFQKSLGYAGENIYMSTYMTLKRLEKDGKVRKINKGEYEWSEPAQAA